jgi:phosphopantothenoylcysteine decarboxylase/phosphopantothenate--cysteine ligase
MVYYEHMNSAPFQNKKILVGITSGIACYKALDLIEDLLKRGADVRTIITENTTELIHLSQLHLVLGPDRVYTDLFEPHSTHLEYKQGLAPITHIKLADWCDICIICPATAHFIAKCAHGLADNLLSTTVLAIAKPLIICPAMNVNMWNNPAVQDNIRIIKERKHILIDPEHGELACGYKGKGRLAQKETILNTLETTLRDRSRFNGKRVLITAGGTYEEIDAARVITNKSSGKMGAALAEQAYLMGADVTLLRSVHAVKPRYHIPEELFTTHKNLLKKIDDLVNKTDILIHAAAVSDFQVSRPRHDKINSSKELQLKLHPTAKIIDTLKQKNPDMFLIGFKAVCGIDASQHNLDSLLSTTESPDMTVANDICAHDRGFESDTNEVWIVQKGKKMKHVSLRSKDEVAREILIRIER